MNRFGIICALLQFMAAIESARGGNWRMSLIWLCYGVAGVALASNYKNPVDS